MYNKSQLDIDSGIDTKLDVNHGPGEPDDQVVGGAGIESDLDKTRRQSNSQEDPLSGVRTAELPQSVDNEIASKTMKAQKHTAS